MLCFRVKAFDVHYAKVTNQQDGLSAHAKPLELQISYDIFVLLTNCAKLPHKLHKHCERLKAYFDHQV